MSDQQAPGAPGIPARWTSSAKSGVGTALNPSSRVWFTLSHGIFNEIYYPRVDQACTRDLGLIVTDGKDFFSEEKRQTDQKIEYLEDGVPAYRLVNSCMEGRYRIEKEIVSDPKRDTVIQHTRFIPTKGNLSDYHVYALLAPHLGNQGEHNDAWIGDYNGTPMLFAERDGNALAMACSSGWVKRSVGYVGTSDGWQDLNEHKLLTRQYDEARGGNVALTGEVDLSASQGEFTIVVGFGQNPAEAGFRALASLQDGFDEARKTYASGWQSWQKRLPTMGDTRPRDKDLFRTSMAVLEIHEAVRFPGGIIASLSIPWGFEKGDDDLGGYHLVWPRDLAETAGGLLAAHAHDDVRRVLHYLQVTQDANGQWPQNMWLDGRPYWSGIQMDETAFPVLLVDMARREGMLKKAELERFWPMVRKAAAFLLRNGPVTQEDRWEEDPGYSPFTLAVEISALLAAADLAKERGEKEIARYLQETADSWNENIERCSRLKPPLDRPGTATMKMAMARKRTAVRLMGPELGGPGPCSPERGRITSWLPAIARRQSVCCRSWNLFQMMAACSLNRYGIRRTFRKRNYSLASLPAPPCRWFGRMPNMLNCADQLRMAEYSICPTKPFSAIYRIRSKPILCHGVSTTRYSRSRRERSCASNYSLRQRSIGARINGPR
jgi:glucoamylase